MDVAAGFNVFVHDHLSVQCEGRYGYDFTRIQSRIERSGFAFEVGLAYHP